NLGLMYANGRGVRQDFKEAVKWYQKAAEQGLPKAQVNLGLMYGEGQGVRQDFKEAVKWYRKAAEQGLTEAQIILGGMYSAPAEAYGRINRPQKNGTEKLATMGFRVVVMRIGN
ncbi:tetratricopeptide repeat protein, partial [Thiolapillus sp.]